MTNNITEDIFKQLMKDMIHDVLIPFMKSQIETEMRQRFNTLREDINTQLNQFHIPERES